MTIYLDPNCWWHLEWWYEDEQGIYDFMIKHEELIRKVAVEKGISLKESIELLAKL
ncbi:hypothetical protein [Ammoniphilus sp. CFH 90114]|uniref:hypothetical protein n=1 Tax=Ammoniphilus sp. CFH 90114 TaxID=2493665 RepID=UPI0013E988A8|nr:hypothetical protein [Ammoniphilus sp. CFH 90114]